MLVFVRVSDGEYEYGPARTASHYEKGNARKSEAWAPYTIR